MLRLAKQLCSFLCSLLQSSLQILGQTHGLLEILSKAVSWFRQWPGQVAPWPRWPGARQTPAFSFTNLYYLPSSEFRNSGRFAAEILNPPEATVISSSTLHYLPSGEFRNSGRFAAEILNPPEAPIISSSTLHYLPSGEFRNSRRIAAEILEQLGPPKSGNSKCQILESTAWAPELPNLLNSWTPPKLGTPGASKQLCFFCGAI